jgi:predicted transglutaminase-like cysteine proteinase
MRRSSLRCLNKRLSLRKSLCSAALTLTLVIGSGGSDAKTRAGLRSPSNSVTTKNYATTPVPGWTDFCRRRPEECAVDTSEPTLIALTSRAWRTLARVNGEVNATIRPVTDEEHWGNSDHWDFAEDGFGDCEDYQLVKRKRLAAAGFPRRALRMTAVIDEDGAPHAVMMVRTDKGDFILDNKRSAVLPWRKTGYIYLQREGDTGPTWVSLGGAFAAPVATAGR